MTKKINIIVLALCWAALPTIQAQSKVYEVFDIKKMPAYPGGEAALGAFLANNIQYPAMAKENNVQGSVLASFVVDSTGRVFNITVLRDIGGGCGREAVRVLGEMPNWSPGELANGQKVSVKYTLPIRFALHGDNDGGPLAYREAGTKPVSPIGNLDALAKYLSKNTVLTKKEKKSFKGKRVPLHFTIGTDGALSGCTSDSSIPQAILAKYCAALTKLGAWTPGQNNGKPVAVQVDLDIPK